MVTRRSRRSLQMATHLTCSVSSCRNTDGVAITTAGVAMDSVTRSCNARMCFQRSSSPNVKNGFMTVTRRSTILHNLVLGTATFTRRRLERACEIVLTPYDPDVEIGGFYT